MAGIAAAVADGEAIKAEVIENEGKGRLIVITAEPEATDAMDATAKNVEPTPEAESTEGSTARGFWTGQEAHAQGQKQKGCDIHGGRGQVSQNSKNPATAPDFLMLIDR